MRTNKIATIATFLISLLTFIVCAILFNHEPKPFWYDVCLACFGSALLGFVVSYSAYSAERRKAMESFWQESLTMINAIRKLKYLSIEEPIDLIRNCIREEYSSFFEINTHKARNELLDWIEEKRYPDDGQPDYRKRMESNYQGLLLSFTNHLSSVMQSYVDFSQISIHPLMNAYGSLDFIIVPNYSIRKKAYDNIYMKIEEIHSICVKSSKKFELATRGNAHLLDGFDDAIWINRRLYTVNEEDQIFASLADKLDNELEWFRSKIYHVKPEKIEPIPLNPMIDFDKPNPGITRVRKESILDTTVVSPFEPLK